MHLPRVCLCYDEIHGPFQRMEPVPRDHRESFRNISSFLVPVLYPFTHFLL